MKTTFQLFFLAFLSATILFSCKKDEEAVTKKRKQSSTSNIVQDSIKSISPAETFPGLQVTIVGEKFSLNLTDNTVLFNGVKATVIRATTDTLVVEAPEGATNGTVTVQVNGTFRANPLNFTYYTLPPAIISNTCNKGKSALKISDFEMYKMERTVSWRDSSTVFYVFYYRFNVTNTGSEIADLSDNTLQNWISDDTLKGSDIAAGGAVYNKSTLSPGKTLNISFSGNSSIMVDGTAVNEKYLLLDVRYHNESCEDLIAQKIVLK